MNDIEEQLREQPRFCIREQLTFDSPPNCWCDGHRDFELSRVLKFEIKTGHQR